MSGHRLTEGELDDVEDLVADWLSLRLTALVIEVRERRALDASTAKLLAIVGSLAHDFEGAVIAHDPSDPRHRSHGGQHTNGRCCAFGNLNPSAVIVFKRWLKEIRDAIEVPT